MRRMIAAGPLSKRPPHNLFAWLSAFWARCATALIALLLAFAVAVAAEDEKPKLGEFIPATPPQPAPEVGFTDMDGKPVKLADFRGKLLVLNLWATWCLPCLEEMPSLEQLQVLLPDNLVVIAVSEDRGGAKVVEPFVEKLGLKKVKIYLDPKSDAGHAFEVRGLPTSIVIGADGKVLGRVEGAADWDSFEMRDALTPFLPKRPAKDPLKRAFDR
jgi:thiol-disulfide isomerase/thioredoxin